LCVVCCVLCEIYRKIL